MKVSVKAMVVGDSTPVDVVETTLQSFFIDDMQKYQDTEKYPLDKDRREGGCQFAFDRDPNTPIRCINCDAAPCKCSRDYEERGHAVKRYALQRFTQTKVYILDLDLNERPRGSVKVKKDHPLLDEEELKLQEFERHIVTIPKILFFYRTKCNGFRIGFESEEFITTNEMYESLCTEAEREVESRTPGRRFSHDGSVAMFHSDRVCSGGRPMRSNAFWNYPRVHNPVSVVSGSA